jgi:hypothetical protein
MAQSVSQLKSNIDKASPSFRPLNIYRAEIKSKLSNGDVAIV